MAYNTKEIIRDKDGNPISQYYNPETDQYEPLEGLKGANKVILYNEDGVESTNLDLNPILDKLSQLTGTVIDEETRKSNELERIANEESREMAEDERDIAEQDRQSKEQIREDKEELRITAENDRVTKELERISNENTRKSNENERISNEDERTTNEDARIASEVVRENNEMDRIELYNLLVQKLADGEFKGDKGDTGNGLEYQWRGTELGVRVEGQAEYVYVDLRGPKGDPGEIENLTVGHIENALGYTPVKSVNNVVADEVGNVELDIDTSVIENRIDDLQQEVNEHKVEKATQNELGHIKLSDIPTPTKASIGLGNVDNVKQMPISGGILENYREKLVTIPILSGYIDLSLGNVFQHAPNGNLTYSITNAVNGQSHSFTLIINMGSTVRTLTFPASVKWQGGEIPDLSGASKTYILTFMTVDGGTTWLGMFGGEF